MRFGNSGTALYSKLRRHFTSYSFDQHAAYDLPGMLNYVLEKTGEEYLYYVGHSQGTLIAFIQFSVDPELASRVGN